MKEGKRFFGKAVVIDYRQNYEGFPRLGISVSKKFGKAHRRNYFKRLCREVFRLHQSEFPSPLDVHLFPRHREILPDFNAIKSDLLQLFSHAKC